MACEYSSLYIESDELAEVNKQQHDYKAASKIFQMLTENPDKIDVDKLKLTLKEFPHMLDYKFWIPNEYMPLLYVINYKLNIEEAKKQILIRTIREVAFEYGDALHYGSAKSDLSTISSIINEDRKLLLDAKFGDTPLSFMLKFGSPCDENFLDCVKLLASVENVNKLDYLGQIPLTIALHQYPKLMEHEQQVMKSVIDILLNLGSFISRIDKDELQEFEDKYFKLTFKTINNDINPDQKIFEYLIRNEIHKFKYLYKKSGFQNISDGENTLLQLAVILGRKSISHILLTNKIDIDVTTKRNKHTALILSALLKRNEIFHMILEKDNISSEIFNEFVKYRCLNLLNEYFYELLKSNNLNVNLKSFNGNTPLHFAIIFGNTPSTLSLLKRGASLLIPNDSGVTPLKLISIKDLNSYYDSCIKFTKYSELLNDGDSKIFMDFKQLVHNNPSEVELVNQLGSINVTKSVLEHPLISTFINIKWHLCEKYFNIFATFKILNCYLIFLILLSNHFNSVYGLLVFETIFYFIWVILSYKLFRNRGAEFIIYCSLSVLLLVDLILFSIKKFEMYDIHVRVIKQINSIIYVLLAASILITLGYKLSLAKWSIMLQKVFQTYFINMLYLMLPLIAFAAGFCQLIWKENHSYDIFYTIYKSSQTLAGNVWNDENLESENHKFIFIILVGFVVITIALMNFLTGLAINDIQRLGKSWEIISYKNVVIFIQFVERFYLKYPSLCKIIRLPNPFIYSSKTGYSMELYIHLNEQFKHRAAMRDFKLNEITIAKIKNLFQRKLTKSMDEKIKAHITELEVKSFKMLNKLSSEIKDLNNAIRDLKEQITEKQKL